MAQTELSSRATIKQQRNLLRRVARVIISICVSVIAIGLMEFGMYLETVRVVTARSFEVVVFLLVFLAAILGLSFRSKPRKHPAYPSRDTEEEIQVRIAPDGISSASASAVAEERDVTTSGEYRSDTFLDQAAILDKIPLSALLLRPDGKIIYINQTARELFNRLSEWLPIEASEVIGSSYYSFHLDADEIRAILSDPEKLPHSSELTIGSEIIETHAVPVCEAEEKTVGTIVTWRQVTYDRNQQRWNQVVEEQIQDASHHLTNTSQELQNIYQQMKILAEQTVSQAQDVSNFAHQSSEQINQIAASIQATSQTIRNIADKVEQSSNIAQNAFTEVQNANEVITELSDTSTEIRKMVQMIEQIMEQTRMLALNATIEAIGAGSAGIGFKVIADEVRDISRETSNVAGGIINMIEQMMQKIPSSVKSMQTVQKVIHQMNDITLSISKDMQSQTDNVELVKNNMDEADRKSQQIVERMKAIESQSQDTKEQVNKGFETTTEIEKIDGTFRIISKRFGEARIVTPNDIYRMNQIINRMFDALISKMNPHSFEKSRELSVLVFTDKKPADVLRKSISTAKEFLKRLDLPEERIDFPRGQVTPTQTYNFLDQFLALLEKTLTDSGIPDVSDIKKAEPVDGKTPNDAFGMIELASRKLQYF